MGKVYVGDIGTDIILDIGVDISSQTTLQIKYKKPNNSTGTWTAVVDNVNRAKYITVSADDLDIAGDWLFTSYMVLTSWTGHSEVVTMRVHALFT